jgi:hypothetical protein
MKIKGYKVVLGRSWSKTETYDEGYACGPVRVERRFRAYCVPKLGLSGDLRTDTLASQSDLQEEIKEAIEDHIARMKGEFID